MRICDWIANDAESILDVGCNVGAWLNDCVRRYPNARLAGVEVNESALTLARNSLRDVELHQRGAENLPFEDQTFQYVTCVEVLEHIPADLRGKALAEMRRVLRPGGRLVLTVPHAGWFAWLDSNNVRFRLPRLYRLVVRQGLRDSGYADGSAGVVWHHHFSERELLDLAGPGWTKVAVRYGGLFVYPLMDWLSWPFYRLGMESNPVRRLFERIAGMDYRISFGKASYGVLLVLERCAEPEAHASNAGERNSVRQ